MHCVNKSKPEPLNTAKKYRKRIVTRQNNFRQNLDKRRNLDWLSVKLPTDKESEQKNTGLRNLCVCHISCHFITIGK